MQRTRSDIDCSPGDLCVKTSEYRMFQAVSKLLFVSILLVSYSAFAEQMDAFWVLGSYSKADNAHREQDRLSTTLGVPVEVRFDEKLAVFRVLTAFHQIDREQLGDIPAWRINLVADLGAASDNRADQTEAAVTTASEPAEPPPPPQTSNAPDAAQPAVAASPIAEDPTAPTTVPEPEPLFPEFGENESLSEYCLRLPNERLCQHPRIERALEADRKLMDHRRRMTSICQKISDPDRRETCEQLH